MSKESFLLYEYKTKIWMYVDEDICKTIIGT